MTNPNFYGNWTTYEVGTPEYEKVISKKRKKI
jgi:hypothetical protein